jgi:tripartite-type tricarboxylate transporter receptor subunit TctC
VRALGTTGDKRSDVAPSIPTIAESGVPGFEATIWLGIMAPRGTPQPIIDKLNAEITKVANRPDVKEAWLKQGAAPMTMKPDEFGAYIRKDIDKWAKVIEAADIKPH